MTPPGRPEVGRPINVRLGDELLAAVDAKADELGITRAEVVRLLIAERLGMYGLEPYWSSWSAKDKQRCYTYDCHHLRGDHSTSLDGAPCLQRDCTCERFLEELPERGYIGGRMRP